MRELKGTYRIQVYIRRRGETVMEGNEFKSEIFYELQDMETVINQFIEDALFNAEDGDDDTN